MIWHQPKLWNKKKGQSLKVTKSSLGAPQTWVAVHDPCVTLDGQQKTGNHHQNLCAIFDLFGPTEKAEKKRSNNFFWQVWKNMDCC